MNIQITDKVLTGNMGAGWTDEGDAASAYAEFLKSEYLALAQKRFPGAAVEVDVSVENATGWNGNPAVFVADGDEWSAEILDLERDLADGEYWSKWLESDDASQYISE